MDSTRKERDAQREVFRDLQRDLLSFELSSNQDKREESTCGLG